VAGDVEKGTTNELPKDIAGNIPQSGQLEQTPISVIIPIYRRDSHEEVFAGSHAYPGKGVYLLKFDNSYSLWRSKTLYYRVYYTR
jgi:golgi resident protein GCP60